MSEMAADLGPVESEAFKSNLNQWPTYHNYRPLDLDRREIRLLRMSAEVSDDLPSFDVLYCSLNDTLEYYALSYYWGAPAERKPILVDGTTVEIRETLYQFLRCLRRRFGSITIWLDVLCINQHDLEERNGQVSMMGSIYQSAKIVVAWLGIGDPDCERAVTRIHEFKRSMADLKAYQALSLRQDAEHLLARPYWTRVWVIQEVLLARELQLLYGSHTVTLHDLKLSVEHVMAFANTVLIPNRFVEETHNYERLSRFQTAKEKISKGENEIWKMAELFHYAQCTDPLDKIYGMRGIARDGDLIEVDYAKTPTQVFLDCLSAWTNECSNRKDSDSPGLLDRAQRLLFSLPLFHSDIEATMKVMYNYQIVDWLDEMSEPRRLSTENDHGTSHHSMASHPGTQTLRTLRLRTGTSNVMDIPFTSFCAHSRAARIVTGKSMTGASIARKRSYAGNFEICRMNDIPSTTELYRLEKPVRVHISPAAVISLLDELHGAGTMDFLQHFMDQRASIRDHLCQC